MENDIIVSDLSRDDIVDNIVYTDVLGNPIDNYTVTDSSYYEVINLHRNEQIRFLVFVLVITIVGNLALIIALCRRNDEQTSRLDFFILQLSIADMFVALISISTDLAWKFTLEWQAGQYMCKIVRYFQSAVTFASINLLVGLSIDRVYATSRPWTFYSKGCLTKVLAAGAWLISLLMAVPMVQLNNLLHMTDSSTQCALHFPMEWHFQLYYTILASLSFFIPTLIFVVCYTLLIHHLCFRKHMRLPGLPAVKVTKENGGTQSPIQKKIRSSGILCIALLLPISKLLGTRSAELVPQPSNSHNSTRSILLKQAQVRTFKISLAFVIGFIVCCGPYFIYDMLNICFHFELSQSNVTLTVFIQSLHHLNSAVNPFIYAAFNTDLASSIFRKTLRLCCPSTKKWYTHNDVAFHKVRESDPAPRASATNPNNTAAATARQLEEREDTLPPRMKRKRNTRFSVTSATSTTGVTCGWRNSATESDILFSIADNSGEKILMSTREDNNKY